MLEEILADPRYKHVHFDISWSEVAKYLVASAETVEVAARLIDRYPDRFLFGTDEVAPKSQEEYLRIYRQYAPLLERLSPGAREMLLKSNYERLFDQARKKVRAWEASHPPRES
jgi:hypothetical protein